MTTILTRGVHHVGLAVPDLEAAQGFFTEALGWRLEGKYPEYPATFVSDGTTILTLWRVADPDTTIAFDRRSSPASITSRAPWSTKPRSWNSTGAYGRIRASKSKRNLP
jgi:catechol 2,3-dioxygenase-like lactoylglutathione lyase family enzyme